jgi:hypothetical protein
MSVNALNKALRIMGCDASPAATTARTAASILLNEEGAFDGNIMEAQLAHDTEKKGPGGAARRRQLGKGDKNKMRSIYNRAAYWAERVRLMQH